MDVLDLSLTGTEVAKEGWLLNDDTPPYREYLFEWVSRSNKADFTR